MSHESQTHSCIMCGQLRDRMFACKQCQQAYHCSFCIIDATACPLCDEPIRITRATASTTVVPPRASPSSPLKDYFQALKIPKFTYVDSWYDASDLGEEEEQPLQAAQKIGLQNLGNSCYINCIVQLFLHHPALFDALVQRFELSLPTRKFLHKIRESYCKFAGIQVYEQCDATLFCNYLLDQLQECETTKHIAQMWKQKWNAHFVCSVCQQSSDKVQEENMCILYPPTPSATVSVAPLPARKGGSDPFDTSSDMFEEDVETFEEDVFVDDNDNEYDYDMTNCLETQRKQTITKKCEKCNTNTVHDIELDLQNLPQLFFFNFHHFFHKSMLIYEKLKLCANNFTEVSKYHLKGFICHRGTTNYGHYKAYCKDHDGWYEYNDSSVIPVRDILHVLHTTQTTFPIVWYEKQP